MFRMMEVAKILGITYQGVSLLKNKGRLKFIQHLGVWVTTKEELEKYYDSRYNRTISTKEDGKPVFNPEKDEYSPNQVAKILGIGAAQIYYFIRRGKIPYKRYKAAYIISLEFCKKFFAEYEETRKIKVKVASEINCAISSKD